MAMSSSEERARLKTLSDPEEFVLSQIAYGYTPVWIDRELKQRSDASGLTVEEMVSTICDKMQIPGIERVWERVRRAGKIYLDAEELERDREHASNPAYASV